MLGVETALRDRLTVLRMLCEGVPLITFITHDVGTFQPDGRRRVGTKRGVASVHGCAGRDVCDLCHLHEAPVLLDSSLT